MIGIALVIFLLIGCGSPMAPPEPVPPGPVLPLRDLALTRHLQIGAAASSYPLRNDTLYAQTLAREFSMLTPENAMKFGPLHPGRHRYDFQDADVLLDFAKANSMEVRGHTLVWHHQLPDWLTEGKFTREELIAILREHIMTVVSRYREQVSTWDVVNEALDDNGSLRDTIWLQGIGPDYIDMAFRWAHEADPQARLFYNDYQGEGSGQGSEAIYALVRNLLQRGVPIHGVGLQMHLKLESPPKSRDVVANIKRLGALGLAVHLTEMDVRIKGAATRQKLAAQAGVYRDMLQACLSTDYCKAFVLWGFTDRYSWIPQIAKGYDAALVFDRSYTSKPAYKELMDVLAGH